MGLVACKNCDAIQKGSFCHICGQKHSVERLDIKYFLGEILDSIIQIDRGFFYTIKELTLRPGDSVREYIQGKRVYHFKPFAYLLIASALYVLMSFWFASNTYFQDFLSGYMSSVEDIEDVKEQSMYKALTWLANNNTYGALLTIPLFSLASYLVFLKSSYNYFEHIILNVYFTAHQMLIYAAFAFLVVEDNPLELLPLLLALCFNLWGFCQFFSNGNILIRLLKSLLTYGIYFLLLVLLLGASLYLLER